METIGSARDILLFALSNAERNIRKTIAGITEEMYVWEPIPASERQADLLLPPDKKRVWRVYKKDDAWTYDYTPKDLQPPPFTTIAWIMNHIAQTTDMYLFCIKTGKPEGIVKYWDDLPVPPTLPEMRDYLFAALARARDYFHTIPAIQANHELNRLTPAPWGEMRPTYVNVWGGIIEHVLQHDMQIAVRKAHILYGS